MASGRVSRLTPEQIKDIRESTKSLKELAEKHKIHIGYVSNLRRDPARGKSVRDSPK